ncbi:MAG: MmcQ/YjbR family DNA-binding protein [Negativicutes bacterium]|jgi:predicted DNA-binding protein (MmcQ/YjbR family)
MDFEELRIYCLKKNNTIEDFPFGIQPNVFKVQGKIFAILSKTADQTSISLKCDPELSINLRLEFTEIIPGYHLNKKHWNTVLSFANIPEETIKWLIDMSYELVCPKTMIKKQK